MSVLVEALSLIVPRTVLDISYPGGTDAFMARMCLAEVPSRLVCADDKLVSVSFCSAAEAQIVGKELLELGIVAVDDDRFLELAFVDQLEGPTLPCDWLEWGRHKEGFTSCWLVGTDPDPMSAPANWTPEQSRDLAWHDYRDEPGRCLKLADLGDHEVWLDFKSGDLMHAPSRPAVKQPALPSRTHTTEPVTKDLHSDETTSPAGGALIAIIRAMLDGHQYQYHQLDVETIAFTVRNGEAAYALVFTANDEMDFVRLTGIYGSNVPAERRVAIAELASRVNTRLAIGNFEVDFADGELRFRISLDVEDGVLSGMMTDNMVGFTLHIMSQYHRAFMRVAFGDLDPAAAAADLE